MPIPQLAAQAQVWRPDLVADVDLTGLAISPVILLPFGYQHFRIYLDAQNDGGGSSVNMTIQLGSGSIDTGANYDIHAINSRPGIGAPTVGSATGQTAVNVGITGPGLSGFRYLATSRVELFGPHLAAWKNFWIVSHTPTLGYGTYWRGCWRNTAYPDRFQIALASGLWIAGSRVRAFGER